jgi:hypothetical protein
MGARNCAEEFRMESVIVIPVITLTNVCLVKKYDDDRFIRREVDALVWDPNVMRALLDERIYRNPMVALIAPQSERKG